MGCLKLTYRKEESRQLKVSWKGNEPENPCTGVENYLYNGKELQTEIATYDFHARMYDPVIGRTFQQDPMGEMFYDYSPYSWVKNNPISRIDPTGMTDFTLNKETGEVNRVGKANDDPDRILRTNSNGDVRRKGEGALGFLVKEENRGKAKVSIEGIEKGILEDGINFKTDDNIIDIGGESQPSVAGVNDFLLKFSNHVGKEIGGFQLSSKGESEISHVFVGKYVNNTDQEARSGFSLKSAGRMDLFGNVDVRVDFHTHLSKFGDSDRLRPSYLGPKGGDVGHKKRQSQYHSGIKYIIITNPKPFEY